MPRLMWTLALLAATAVHGVGAQTAEPPEMLARRLQQSYDKIRDFRADFTQVTRSGVLRTQRRAEGTIAVKKPGRVRMAYARPEKKEIVYDGTNIWDYVPADKTVVKMDAPSGDEAPTAMVFLGGRGDILRDFTPANTESPVPGAVALRLTPRQAERDYEYLVVAVDPKSLQMRALVTFDQLGGETQIAFTNLRENVNIPDSTFTFTPPRGVEVFGQGANR
jgi:outer membrane lipoprotein carrier protein